MSFSLQKTVLWYIIDVKNENLKNSYPMWKIQIKSQSIWLANVWNTFAFLLHLKAQKNPPTMETENARVYTHTTTTIKMPRVVNYEMSTKQWQSQNLAANFIIFSSPSAVRAHCALFCRVACAFVIVVLIYFFCIFTSFYLYISHILLHNWFNGELREIQR